MNRRKHRLRHQPAWRPSLRHSALCALSAALIGMVALLVVAPEPAAAAECPNEAIRAEQGEAALALPDCRAYELVSPPGSIPYQNSAPNPAEPSSYTPRFRAAVAGGRFTYYSLYPYPGDESQGLYFLSTRGPDGWSTQAPTPPQGPASLTSNFRCFPSVFFSTDLSAGILADGFREARTGRPCYGDEPPLIPGEPRGYANLFRFDSTAGAFQLVNVTPEGVQPANASFQGASADLSHVVFSSTALLTPEAPTPEGEFGDLYEWAAGTVRLLTVSPTGAPVQGVLVDGDYQSSKGSAPAPQGDTAAAIANSVSADGERAFFYASGGLYLRLNAMQPQSPVDGAAECTDAADACTVQLDVPRAGAGGSAGGGEFWYASADGDRAFFTDESRLTPDSTATSGRPDLYEWRSPGVEGCAEAGGCLADLTADASEPADVLGISGISEDGSYVYFAAEGVLTNSPNPDGDVASPGDCKGRSGPVEPPSGSCNLYLRHAGTTAFVGTVNAATDYHVFGLTESFAPAVESFTDGGRRISPDGRFFAFNSTEPLTGFDNSPARPEDCEGGHCSEIFLYAAEDQAEAARLNCVSCGPTGASPSGPTEFPGNAEYTLQVSGPVYPPPRNVLDDGRVFFETPDALVPADTDGSTDVYEYEEGQVHLISSGTDPAGAEFLEASSEGHEVFFGTAQALVPSRDTDNSNSVYDAREEGGFPELPGPAAPCEGEVSCRGAGGSPIPTVRSATSTHEGPGNQKPLSCRKGFHAVPRHGTEACVKKKPKKHHRSKNYRGRHHKHSRRRSHR
jgi:hypothetical protein